MRAMREKNTFAAPAVTADARTLGETDARYAPPEACGLSVSFYCEGGDGSPQIRFA